MNRAGLFTFCVFFLLGGMRAQASASLSQTDFVQRSLDLSLTDLKRSHPDLKEEVLNAAFITAGSKEGVVTLTLKKGAAMSYACSQLEEKTQNSKETFPNVVCTLKD